MNATYIYQSVNQAVMHRSSIRNESHHWNLLSAVLILFDVSDSMSYFQVVQISPISFINHLFVAKNREAIPLWNAESQMITRICED